jgi:hypothetical protein
VAKRGIVLSCIDISFGAAASFNACREINERAGGCKFLLKDLELHGSGGEPRRCHPDEDSEEGGEETSPPREIGRTLYEWAGFTCAEALCI